MIPEAPSYPQLRYYYRNKPKFKEYYQKNKEQKKQYNNNYYNEHHNEILAKQAIYRQVHRDEILQRQKQKRLMVVDGVSKEIARM